MCIYIEGKKQNTQPDKPSAPPSQAHCQGFTCTPRVGLNTVLFAVPGTQKRSIPVNAHHPAPNPFLHTARYMPKTSTQPKVV